MVSGAPEVFRVAFKCVVRRSCISTGLLHHPTLAMPQLFSPVLRDSLTADPLQLGSLASDMLRVKTRGRHGQGEAGQKCVREAQTLERWWWGAGMCEEMWEHRDGEKGFAPLPAHLQLFMLH